MSNFDEHNKNLKALEEQRDRIRLLSEKMGKLALPPALEKELEKEKKKAKAKIWVLFFEIFIGIVGFTLIVCNAGWLVAIGIWLMLWGNNINIFRAIGEKSKAFEFWNKDK
jgi:hypothetical protein